jgi:hypothetical protein
MEAVGSARVFDVPINAETSFDIESLQQKIVTELAQISTHHDDRSHSRSIARLQA